MAETKTETVETKSDSKSEVKDSKTAIADAVKAAAESINKGENVDDSDELLIEVPDSEEAEDSDETAQKESKTEEDQEDNTEDSEEDGEDGDETDEDNNARKVWAALKQNPIAVVKWIAEQARLDININENAKVTAKEKKDIAAIITKHMGENYSFMAPQLGAAIEEILSERVESRFQEQDIQKEMDMVRVTTEQLMDNDKLSDKDKEKVAREMGRRFKSMPPQVATMEGLKEYVNDIYLLSSTGIKKAAKKVGEEKERVKRQIQNRQDDEPSSVSGAEFVTKQRPKNLTHRQAAEAALKGIVYAE